METFGEKNNGRNRRRHRHSGSEQVRLNGIVTPVEWDDQENVTAVALCATDDEEYLIENSTKFIELAHSVIEASGMVHKEKKSFRTINIKKFRIIHEY